MFEIGSERLTKVFLVLGVCMALTPGLTALGSVLEPEKGATPQAPRRNTSEDQTAGTGLSGHFGQLRGCKVQVMAWYDRGVVHVPLAGAQTARPRESTTRGFIFYRCAPTTTDAVRSDIAGKGRRAIANFEISGDEQ